MSEAANAPVEAARSRHNRAKARLLAVPLVAGLALAACTTGSGENSSGSAHSGPNTSESTSMPTATAATKETAPTTPTSAPTISSSPAKASGLAGCKPYFDVSKYQNHEYEVCTAYIGNAAEIALQGFYKFGNNRVGYLSDAARHHFETRYWDQPRQQVEQAVDAWPKTSSLLGNKVEETVTLMSLSSNLKADRGLLRTRESWKVIAPDGDVLYNEPLHTKDITMCRGRLPGHPLHLWMVVSASRIPDFDCIGFDKSHDISP